MLRRTAARGTMGAVSGVSRGRVLGVVAALLVVTGLAVMVWAGASSMRYYGLLEERAPCLVHGLCDPAVREAGKVDWWWRAAGGAVLVLAGAALAVPLRPRRAAEAPAGRRGRLLVPGGALVAGGVVLLGSLPTVLAAAASPTLAAAVLAWLGLAQAWVLDWWAAQAQPWAHRPRRRLAVCLAASALGLGAAAATAAALWSAGAGVVLPVAGAVVVDAALVALVLLVATVRTPTDGPPAAPRRDEPVDA